jgi:hypothetical protein
MPDNPVVPNEHHKVDTYWVNRVEQHPRTVAEARGWSAQRLQDGMASLLFNTAENPAIIRKIEKLCTAAIGIQHYRLQDAKPTLRRHPDLCQVLANKAN